MTRSRLVVLSAALVAAFGAAAAIGAIALDPARAAVGPLPPEALILPADAKFVGGIDVKKLTGSAFYEKYAKAAEGRHGMRPETFRDIEEKTGLNPERDLDQVIFAGSPSAGAGGMAVVLGRFDQAKIGSTIEKGDKVSWKNVRGVTLYVFGEGRKGAGSLAFLDERTLVLGSQKVVEAAILAREEGGQTLRSNTGMLALLEKVQTGSTFWLVGDQSALQNMPQSIPGPGGPGSSITLPGLHHVLVTGDVDPLVSLEITGEAADEPSARQLADVVRGAVALATLQASQKPELKDLAAAVSVTQEQKSVRVNARVPYELIDALQAQGRRVQPAPGASNPPTGN
jgi:hypothetical protein